MTFTEAVQLAEAMSKKVWEISEILTGAGISPSSASEAAQDIVRFKAELPKVTLRQRPGHPRGPDPGWTRDLSRHIGEVLDRLLGEVLRLSVDKFIKLRRAGRRDDALAYRDEVNSKVEDRALLLVGIIHALGDKKAITFGQAKEWLTKRLMKGKLGPAMQKMGSEPEEDDPADWWKKQ